MKWVYTRPERKEFVFDGRQIYSYFPEDKQATVSDVPEGNQASTPLLFLGGRGDIARDFTASAAQPPIAGAVGLKLTPRRAEPDYEFLVLALDAGSLQIRALSTRDRQGGDSTLTFTNMKENRGVSDKEFVFRPPRGVKVITDAPRN
jgi:outer membrane lipoprotein carrier protein